MSAAEVHIAEPQAPKRAAEAAAVEAKRAKQQIVAGNVDLCKPEEQFRNYKDSARHELVSNHYRNMRTNQTLDFVKRMHEKYSFETPRAMMTIREAFTALETYVDSSDPDLGLPNLLHMLQTAEGIRKAGHPDWFQLVGLLHDMGKIMFLWGTPEDGQQGTADGPQWALGGDTWVVGCRLPDSMVFPEYNTLNPDMHDERLNTEYGIYEPHCGLNNLFFAYGHDEYMYQMLVGNNTTIPEEGLAMIRFHSAYPLHRENEYKHLLTESDEELLHWVREFNKFDLYTKDEHNDLDIEALWPYYQSLIDKYLGPGKLKW